MEHTLRADGAGTVSRIDCAPGQQVDVGDLLVVLEPDVSDGTAPLRIANCSGFFGDRIAAAKEMVEGGPIDVLMGDWLAELTMYILHKTRQRSGGYARTFLRQLEDVLPTCVERGITVVSNAGGLHPEALADAVRELAKRQGVEVAVASVSGDDITARLGELQQGGERFVNLDTGEELPAGAPVVTANAYLPARPIADALAAGAQVVVTGRVTDAALVVGPALHAFGWQDDDLDAIAGAVVAGHVIECGAQCCGGNYAFFEEIPHRERIGFPIAEMQADGSSVITKHADSGGAVTVGTVTAQLLYEIGGPRYLSPDAVARFDTIALTQEGPDRVRIAGRARRGAAALPQGDGQPRRRLAQRHDPRHHRCPGGGEGPHGRRRRLGRHPGRAGGLRRDGGGPLGRPVRRRHGLPAPRRAGRRRAGRRPRLLRSRRSRPASRATRERSSPRPRRGRRAWPTTGRPPSRRPRCSRTSSARDARWPASMPSVGARSVRPRPAAPDTGAAPGRAAAPAQADLVRVPLHVLVGARSGDKGGAANVGVWADTDAVAGWLLDELTVDALKALRARGRRPSRSSATPWPICVP